MNIQFRSNRESGVLTSYHIYFNRRYIGHIAAWGNTWNVSFSLEDKSWSGHAHPTLEKAQDFVSETIAKELGNNK